MMSVTTRHISQTFLHHGQRVSLSLGAKLSPKSNVQMLSFLPKAYIHSNRDKRSVALPNKIVLSDSLKPGYQKMRARLTQMAYESAIVAGVSPCLSGLWLALTEQSLFESPVALACLLAGGAIISNRIMQTYRIKKYAQISVLCNEHPSTSKEENAIVKKILAGENSRIRFTAQGLILSGITSSPDPNAQMKLAKPYLQTLKSYRIVIPECALRNSAAHRVNFVYDRWLARITFPMAILNLIAIAAKEPKDRRIDDYVVAASSAYSVYDYLSGPSVGDAREEFTNYLNQPENIRALLSRLIDKDMLDAGMNFLIPWSADRPSIGVRIGRTGSLILYKEDRTSIGGPYPIKQIANHSQKKTTF